MGQSSTAVALLQLKPMAPIEDASHAEMTEPFEYRTGNHFGHGRSEGDRFATGLLHFDLEVLTQRNGPFGLNDEWVPFPISFELRQGIPDIRWAGLDRDFGDKSPHVEDAVDDRRPTLWGTATPLIVVILNLHVDL